MQLYKGRQPVHDCFSQHVEICMIDKWRKYFRQKEQHMGSHRRVKKKNIFIWGSVHGIIYFPHVKDIVVLGIILKNAKVEGQDKS